MTTASTSTADDHFAYALLATSYLLGTRGRDLDAVLVGAVESSTLERMRGVLRGLSHADRSSRAAALAPGVALLGDALAARSLDSA